MIIKQCDSRFFSKLFSGYCERSCAKYELPNSIPKKRHVQERSKKTCPKVIIVLDLFVSGHQNETSNRLNFYQPQFFNSF